MLKKKSGIYFFKSKQLYKKFQCQFSTLFHIHELIHTYNTNSALTSVTVTNKEKSHLSHPENTGNFALF